MVYLHNNREQFKDAIYLAYDQTGIILQHLPISGGRGGYTKAD